MADIKVPPHDDTVEASVLGSLLIDKDAISSVVDFLRPDHFYKETHAMIFEAMINLFEKHEPVDVVTVAAALKKNGTIKSAGGASYLSELVNAVPTSSHVEHYARLLLELYTKRKLISVSARIGEAAFDEKGSASEILDKAEAEIFALSQSSVRRNFISIKDALAESFDRLDELHKRGSHLRGVATGFSDLDNKLAGMQDANLLILAARPGQGKTALVLNIAQHITITEKLAVGMFSLEMSKEELVDRLLVSQADVDAWRLKTGKLSDEDFTKLSEAMGELAEAQFYIDDTPGINILEMRTKARRLQLERGIKLLIVDYLQLVDPGRRFDNRVQEVSIVSQSLKNLARELRIPVLAVSQLSRAVESRGTRVPQLADLRESGAIEQDADVVMFLYREEVEMDKWEELPIVKLLIAKHRNGPLGEIDLLFKGDRIRFYGMDKKHDSLQSAVATASF